MMMSKGRKVMMLRMTGAEDEVGDDHVEDGVKGED